ncbi:hypothetical protein [Bathymodiolus platifrons methanotrophic gill symbiont]|uniref:hypothetical protein n=1 Tax=Bathymodiolus platifrons methanotrophic gill symbiont TaxID=113268 RepID=UPI0011C76BE8|nr:hypothetical protein [Bathymodiolus platifrons methanotrophic gill symbiont]
MMQHIIELDHQTEKNLSEVAMYAHKSKDDILLAVIQSYLLQQAKRNDLEQFLKPYKVKLKGYKFDRDTANER